MTEDSPAISTANKDADIPAFAKILNCSVVGLAVQGQAKLCGRCCAGFGMTKSMG